MSFLTDACDYRAPYNSWTQVLERCMTMMNMAWQGISVAWLALVTAELEKLVMAAGTGSELRKLCEKSPEIERQYRESHQPGFDVMKSFASQMELKGTDIQHNCLVSSPKPLKFPRLLP